MSVRRAHPRLVLILALVTAVLGAVTPGRSQEAVPAADVLPGPAQEITGAGQAAAPAGGRTWNRAAAEAIQGWRGPEAVAGALGLSPDAAATAGDAIRTTGRFGVGFGRGVQNFYTGLGHLGAGALDFGQKFATDSAYREKVGSDVAAFGRDPLPAVEHTANAIGSQLSGWGNRLVDADAGDQAEMLGEVTGEWVGGPASLGAGLKIAGRGYRGLRGAGAVEGEAVAAGRAEGAVEATAGGAGRTGTAGATTGAASTEAAATELAAGSAGRTGTAGVTTGAASTEAAATELAAGSAGRTGTAGASTGAASTEAAATELAAGSAGRTGTAEAAAGGAGRTAPGAVTLLGEGSDGATAARLAGEARPAPVLPAGETRAAVLTEAGAGGEAAIASDAAAATSRLPAAATDAAATDAAAAARGPAAVPGTLAEPAPLTAAGEGTTPAARPLGPAPTTGGAPAGAAAAGQPVDVALGLFFDDAKTAVLHKFARKTRSVTFPLWEERGLAPAGLGFEDALVTGLDRAVESGGRIKFRLDGLDLEQALTRRGRAVEIGHTNWELQQVLSSERYYAATDFYLDGARLTTDEARQLGLTLQPR